MAEAVISIVVETLGNLLIEEGKFLHGVRDQATQLKAELERLQGFLKDADAKQNEEQRIRVCVSQARDFAYEAEDLLERYAFKVESRRGRGVTSIIKRCVCLLDECFTRYQVGSDIESLQAKISGLTKSFPELGITTIMKEEGGPSSRQQQLTRTYSGVAAENLVGVHSQVEELAKNLIGENCKLVSIWGMGGLGKTTLAREVYHHPSVRRYFEAFSWICVSQKWETKALLRGVITKFMPEMEGTIKEWDDDKLVRKLLEFQQNHKCLVVVDDIWSIDVWECIKHAFPIRESGSKILLTTRIREVPTHIDPSGFLHQPRFLTEEESWKLLQKKSLIQSRRRDCNEIHNMEEQGKYMVEHCGGLPLAVLVLGGILATKHSLTEWENVHKYIKSYLGKGNNIGIDQGGIENILALSYNDLPYQLKPCFLYLSKFLEDADIETEPLYQIWMAEGLISMEDRTGEESMMDVVERYLEELAKRCMVFVEMEEDMPSIRRFKSCRLHDVMRELCLLKAKEENFLQLIDYGQRNDTELVDFSSITSRNPRLAMHLDFSDASKKRVMKGIAALTGIKHLRSLTLSLVGWYNGEIGRTIKFLLYDLKMLRVLSIEGLYVERSLISSLSSAIGKLIHLRYLSLRRSYFKMIPSSISNLKHLQTLDLRCVGHLKISSSIQKLVRLKHLYLKLNSKCRLDGLQNLEILKGFNNRCSDVKVLSTLPNLRSLTAVVNDKLSDLQEFINQVNRCAYIRFLSLEIWFCDFRSDEGSTLLRDLFSCSRFNCLYINQGRISKLPEYEFGFSTNNLHSLKLSLCKMEEDPMRTLEKLPNLTSLSLRKKSFMGEEMICHPTGFPQLKYLSLRSLTNLSNWLIEEGAMPNLSRLQIDECKKLKMIPDGLRFVTTLKELEIRYMPEEFKSRLQVKDGQEGEDFDKVRHVPSIIFSS